MSALIEIRRVTKKYRRGGETIEVLHGIDLDIPRGDFVALMGPSGSGKTTLLNLIGGLDTPTSGTITVDGERIEGLAGGALARWRAANVGFVFQFYNLLPRALGAEERGAALLLTGLSAGERRRHAEIALALVGLRDRRTPQAEGAVRWSGATGRDRPRDRLRPDAPRVRRADG